MIKTLDSSVDKKQVIIEALKLGEYAGIPIEEKGAYEALLGNGDKITVYKRRSNAGDFDVCAFEIEPSTVFIIRSTMSNTAMENLLRTLKVEKPIVQSL